MARLGRIFALLVLLIPSPMWPVEREGLRLLADVDQDIYRPGDPVIVEVSWTNMTNHTLTINDWRGPSDRSSPHFGSNDPPDFSVFYGNQRLDYRGPIICSTSAPPPTVSLLPGQGIIKRFDVSRSYDLSRPGQYRVRIVYAPSARPPQQPYPSMVLLHPDVEFSVIQ